MKFVFAIEVNEILIHNKYKTYDDPYISTAIENYKENEIRNDDIV